LAGGAGLAGGGTSGGGVEARGACEAIVVGVIFAVIIHVVSHLARWCWGCYGYHENGGEVQIRAEVRHHIVIVIVGAIRGILSSGYRERHIEGIGSCAGRDLREASSALQTHGFIRISTCTVDRFKRRYCHKAIEISRTKGVSRDDRGALQINRITGYLCSHNDNSPGQILVSIEEGHIIKGIFSSGIGIIRQEKRKIEGINV